MTALPFVADAGNYAKAAANVKRLESEKVAGGKTFKVGQTVNVRLYDGAAPSPCFVVSMETSGLYGNIVRVQFEDGSQRRVVAARGTKRK